MTGTESIPLLARVTEELIAVPPQRRHHRLLTATGRSWLMGRKESFDLIDIPLQDTGPGAAFGMAEEYRLTVEAFREYLSHLRPGGALSIHLYLVPPPRVELRILATAATALEEMGAREPGSHIAAVRSWGSLSILVKRTPLTGSEVDGIRRFARERWFDLVSLPGLRPEESNVFVRLPSDDYFRACAAILSPTERERFMERYLFDVTPVRDDAPFFNHFLRFGNIGEIYRVMGSKWQFFLEEGYLFPAILIQALLMSTLLMLAPAFVRTRDDGRPASGVHAAGPTGSGPTARRFLPYFALIGIGFMFCEIFLIQKLILPLENATYAIAAVLASLLAGSGAGSLLSQRYAALRRPLIATAVGLLVILYAFLVQHAPAVLTSLTPALRFTAVIAALIPLGLPMGIPFPLGMRLLGERDPSLIPWAWVVNGAFSVMAPVMALMLAMAAGFGVVAYLAAGAYLLASLVIARASS